MFKTTLNKRFIEQTLLITIALHVIYDQKETPKTVWYRCHGHLNLKVV